MEGRQILKAFWPSEAIMLTPWLREFLVWMLKAATELLPLPRRETL